jgi:hypothetical protein
VAVALGGFAKAVLSSGLIPAGTIDLANVERIAERGLDPSGFSWAVIGMLGAAVVAWLGSGYRCINCDTQK